MRSCGVARLRCPQSGEGDADGIRDTAVREPHMIILNDENGEMIL